MAGGRAWRGRVLMAALLLTGAVACTSADSGSPADRASERRTARAAPAVLAALRDAQRATERAGSARVRSTTTLGPDAALTSTGTLAWRDGLTGALTLTYTGGGVAATLAELGSTSTQARYLPDAYYTRVGDAFAARAGGRHWIRYAWDDLAGLGGASGARLAAQIREAAPHRAVALLLVSGDVRLVGTEPVRGEPATHYTGSVQPAGLPRQTVDLWIAGDGLLIKKAERSGTVIQTAYYDDYGLRVSVQPPPARDTQDFKDLVRPGRN
ncbi:hypothetical protein RKD23_003118 [Streptomyces sp. SAI-170]|uniref:hypothetical protein n=1 Tax=Streptomyces sp. SAI-170 TaxID=3377729 RepID=UPI003C7E4049